MRPARLSHPAVSALHDYRCVPLSLLIRCVARFCLPVLASNRISYLTRFYSLLRYRFTFWGTDTRKPRCAGLSFDLSDLQAKIRWVLSSPQLGYESISHSTEQLHRMIETRNAYFQWRSQRDRRFLKARPQWSVAR